MYSRAILIILWFLCHYSIQAQKNNLNDFYEMEQLEDRGNALRPEVCNNYSHVYECIGFAKQIEELLQKVEKLGITPAENQRPLAYHQGWVEKYKGFEQVMSREYEKAIPHLTISLKLFQQTKDTFQMAALHNLLGFSYQFFDFDKAIAHYDSAAKLYKRLEIIYKNDPEKLKNAKEGTIAAYNYMSATYMDDEQYNQAQILLSNNLRYRDDLKVLVKREGLPILHELKFKLAEAYEFQNLGISQEYSGEYLLAERNLEKAISIYGEVIKMYEKAGCNNAISGVENDLLSAQSELANLYDIRDDDLHQEIYRYEKVKNLQDAIIKQLQKNLIQNPNRKDSVSLAIALFNRAQSEIYRDSVEIIHQNLKEALNICPKNTDRVKAHIFTGFGELSKKQQQFKEAMAYFQQAAELCTIDGEMPNKNFKNIRTTFKHILLEVLQAKANTQFNYAQEMQNKTTKQYRLQAALEDYLLAIELLDDIRKHYYAKEDQWRYTDNHAKIYDEALKVVEILYDMTSDKQLIQIAFEISEKSKAFTLRQAMRSQYAINFSGIPSALIDDERFIRARINRAQSAKMRNRWIYTHQTILEQIEFEYPKYYKYVYDTKVISISKVQDQLPSSKHIFLQLFVGENTLMVMGISKKDSAIYFVAKSKKIKKALGDLKSIIIKKPQPYEKKASHYAEKAAEVYKHLFAPILDRLNISKTLDKHLIISSSGDFLTFPFEALVSLKPKTENVHYSDLEYIIQSFASISYGFSATSYFDDMNGENPLVKKMYEKEIIAIAPLFGPEVTEEYLALFTESERDSTYMTYFEPHEQNLRGIKRIIRNIEKLYKGETLVSLEATKRNLLNEISKYRIIHIVTHGVYDTLNPIMSRIYLAVEKSGDFSLSTREIFSMDIHAELVILMSCESGLGNDYSGEGIISQAYAMRYAGGKSAIMSFWMIPTKESIGLIENFYKGINKGYTTAKSLKKAKESVISKDGAHPYYWAGMVLIGKDATFNVNSTRKYWYIGIGFGLMLLIIAFVKFRK